MTSTNRPPSPTLPGPPPIRRLEESVINRIAAGEIIHRPSSALKELLENSLDAGSTSIKVMIKDGGMKLLQIQDNGSGIRKEDLPILAERFTTSKITSFEDLSRLTTYGFRGEALASISYVSHLSVITKTRNEKHAWKASYEDGSLVSKDGKATEPKACAGNDGTTITIENLFYNTPTRLSALRGSSEEYSRILDVITRYAVHNPHVSFSCKKAGSSAPDVTTPSGSTVKQAVGQLYGQSIIKELLHVSIPGSSDDKSGATKEGNSWSAEVYFTSPNYQAKKFVFLLFINHRLVDSSRIKKALEAVYIGILPRGASPFTYLSLQIHPESIDVNVHPTKREVHFLDEDIIIQRVSDKVRDSLLDGGQSRTFEYQTLLTNGKTPMQVTSKEKGKGKEKEVVDDVDQVESKSSAPSSVIAGVKKIYSQHKVRTSQQDRTLDAMFTKPSPLQAQADDGTTVAQSQHVKPPDICESDVTLTSIKRLRREVEKGKHEELTNILRKHVFVGIVDTGRCLSLIQHDKKLYLVNHGALAEEFFYQLGLTQFGNFPKVKLDPPPPLHALVKLAIEVEDTSASKLSKSEIVKRIIETILEKRAMLKEYFQLVINDNGLVECLPLLLKGYVPNLDKLPLFLMRLGPQVDWESETECFESFLRELAYFYVPEPLFIDYKAESPPSQEEVQASTWQVQHLLFPAMAKYMVAPKSLLDGDVVQVANLPDLYRVFERC